MLLIVVYFWTSTQTLSTPAPNLTALSATEPNLDPNLDPKTPTTATAFRQDDLGLITQVPTHLAIGGNFSVFRFPDSFDKYL